MHDLMYCYIMGKSKEGEHLQVKQNVTIGKFLKSEVAFPVCLTDWTQLRLWIYECEPVAEVVDIVF